MPKYWGKQIFTHRSFPKVGQNQKTEREKKETKKEDWKLVITMASYALQTPPRVAHAKPPGPITFLALSTSCCHTLLSGFRLPWPLSCWFKQQTPFMGSDKLRLWHFNPKWVKSNERKKTECKSQCYQWPATLATANTDGAHKRQDTQKQWRFWP